MIEQIKHSDMIELRFLGASFVNNEYADRVVNYGRPSLFFNKTHQQVFKIIKEMRGKDLSVDQEAIYVYSRHDKDIALIISDLIYHGDWASYLGSDLKLLKQMSLDRKIRSMDSYEFDEIKSLVDELSDDESKITDESPVLTTETLQSEISEYYERGKSENYSTGLTILDNYYLVAKGQVSVITGIPAHGKSAFTDFLLVNLATKHGWKFLIFSPENLPVARHLEKLISIKTQKPFFLNSNERGISKDEIKETVSWLGKHFKFLDPAIENRKLEYILNQITPGIDGILIDPFNEILADRLPDISETDFINKSLMLIKSVCVSKNVHCWTIAHPTKLIKDKNGGYPAPSLYDISGSAHWRNRADMGITVFRPSKAGTATHDSVEIIISKVRFKDCGQIGRVELYYDKRTGIFHEFPDA